MIWDVVKKSKLINNFKFWSGKLVYIACFLTRDRVHSWLSFPNCSVSVLFSYFGQEWTVALAVTKQKIYVIKGGIVGREFLKIIQKNLGPKFGLLATHYFCKFFVVLNQLIIMLKIEIFDVNFSTSSLIVWHVYQSQNYVITLIYLI